MTLHAANMAYEHAEGWLLGWFGEHGLEQLRIYPKGQAKPPVHVLHSWKNDARAVTLHDALRQYFDGQRTNFAEITLDLTTGTPFQQAVWKGACETSYGSTSTYGDLAERLGKPAGSARAVGAALGQNPIAILIPCHRFLAANGNLVNYAYGLDWKERLLQREGAIL